MNTLRNRVILVGHLGNDPEGKVLDSGTRMVKFSLATNDSFKNSTGERVTETQWHNIVAWGKTAELLEEWLEKGKHVMLEGRIQTRSYENEGKRLYFTEIVVNDFLLLSPRND